LFDFHNVAIGNGLTPRFFELLDRFLTLGFTYRLLPLNELVNGLFELFVVTLLRLELIT